MYWLTPAGLFGVLTIVTLSISRTEALLGDEVDYPVVNITNGQITGLKFISQWTNKTIFTFRGIPYASPPTGNLRFKDPTPPSNWTTSMNCSMERAYCYQPANLFEGLPESPKSPSAPISNGMSEDCLYLNVYTPELQPKQPLPVIVYIFGGAFLVGAANYTSYGPDFLVGEGVVVVMMNYRLGAFGFLTLGTADAPGNYALKDQRFALKWVQNEIKNFGGDPNNVTLFGESAGSASVHLHYLSPLSVGLFHRAIADSGTGIVGWAAREDETWYSLTLASLVNCTTTNLTLTLQCLQNVSADTLLQAQVLVPPNPDDDTKILTLRFIPTVDKWSKEPFLPELPVELMKKKSGSLVPILMGTNRNEGSLDLLAANATEIANITNTLDEYIPPEMKGQIKGEKLGVIEDKIKMFYFNDTAASSTNLGGFMDLNTDVWFAYSTAVCARYYRQRAAVFLYYFTFDGAFKDPSTIYLTKTYNFPMIAHAEELNYMFVVKNINQVAANDSKEMTTLRRMVKMWTNFAKNGDGIFVNSFELSNEAVTRSISLTQRKLITITPTPGLDPLLQNVTWLPVNQSSTRHLLIDVNLTMVQTNYLDKRVQFWDNLLASTAAKFYQTSFVLVTCSAVLFAYK